MILRANGSGTQFIANKLLESLGISKTELNIVVQTNDLEAIKHMIVGGVGISICSRFSMKNLSSGDQIITYPLESARKRYFSLHYMNSKKIVPEIKLLIDYIRELICDEKFEIITD